MTKVNEQELNKKLAGWAGFQLRDNSPFGKLPKGEFTWYQPGELWIGKDLPDFTQSLDACFKWLVPKLDKKVEGTDCWITGLDITFSFGAHRGGIICGVQAEVLIKSVHHTQYSSIQRTPALALCLAIEKLIDSEV